MLSVSYAGKNAYSAGKTSGVLRGGASGANRCYVLAHCAPPPPPRKAHTTYYLKRQNPLKGMLKVGPLVLLALYAFLAAYFPDDITNQFLAKF